jgi:rhodanese-related sulfurtransferase
MKLLFINTREIRTLPSLRFCSLILFAALLFNPAQAADTPDLTRSKVIVPEHIAGVKTLTAEDVVELAMKIDDLIIVDARIAADRKHGYIEDSVSLPDIKTSCAALGKIIPSKNSPALFYCNGIKCGRSVVAIKIATSCGYTNMYWFKGGFEEWKNKGFQYAKDL